MTPIQSHSGNGTFETKDGIASEIWYDIHVTQEYVETRGRRIPTLQSVSVTIDPSPFPPSANGILTDQNGSRWNVVLSSSDGSGFINGPA